MLTLTLAATPSTAQALTGPWSAPGVTAVPEVCAGVRAPAFRGAATDTRLNDLFARYGDDNSRVDDWTGADSTYSTTLPGGRVAFIFSDTFLGQVNPDGSRPKIIEEGGTTPFINNSFVVKSGDRLTTVHGGTVDDPKALMPPRDHEHWYWAGDAITVDGRVQ